MTERERCMDELLLCMAEMMFREDGDPERSPKDDQRLQAAALRFRNASEKQHASDQNDVRRSMGLADCKNPDEEKPREDASPRLDLVEPVKRTPCTPCGKTTCDGCPRTDCQGDERK